MNKQQALAVIDARGEEFARISDQIWGFAETAFAEYRSAACLCDTLRQHGFAVEEGIAGIPTAFQGSFGESGPVIAILGEYDALTNMSQEAGVAEERPEVAGRSGHGCGHNMLGTASLAAAVAVKEYLQANKLPGTVVYYGCPGEEGGSGKAFMAREGVFRDVDAALCWHPSYANGVMDCSTLANYQVLYRFAGTASHAAVSPHLGRSALDAVELMNVGVNFLREHILPSARVHYAITNAGGLSPNVVQPQAEVLYLMRAPKNPQVEEIYQRINKIAQGAALMTETQVEILFQKACADIIPNKTLFGVLDKNLHEVELPAYTLQEQEFAAKVMGTIKNPDKSVLALLKPQEVPGIMERMKGKALCDMVMPFDPHSESKVLPGSSDVGDVSWNVPTGQIGAACYALGTAHHSWQLVAQGCSGVAHKGVRYAGKVLAGAAIDLLCDGGLIQAAKEELAQRLGGASYHCAIPPEIRPKPLGKNDLVE